MASRPSAACRIRTGRKCRSLRLLLSFVGLFRLSALPIHTRDMCICPRTDVVTGHLHLLSALPDGQEASVNSFSKMKLQVVVELFAKQLVMGIKPLVSPPFINVCFLRRSTLPKQAGNKSTSSDTNGGREDEHCRRVAATA